jgi:4-amino-4-deoxy-L-arabinose transferase-like glycosyltransferase
LLIILALLFVAAVRFRLRDMPLERDEGEYAYAGQLMLHGIPPYKEAYNMKLPGTYAAYALIMALFGQSPAGIHVGVLLVNLASIILMFLLGRALLDEAAGVVAAVSFALLSLSPAVLGLAGHATHFVVLPALGGILLLVRAVNPCLAWPGPPLINTPLQRGVSDRREAPTALAVSSPTPPDHTPSETAKAVPPAPERSPTPLKRGVNETGREGTRQQLSTFNFQLSTFNWRLLCAGLLFGVAFLMKQHGIFFGLFGALYLIWTRVAAHLEAKEENGFGRGPTQPRGSGGRRNRRDAKNAENAPVPAPSAPIASLRLTGPPAAGPTPQAGPRLSHFAAGKLRPGTGEVQSPKSKVQSPGSEVPSSKFQVSSPGTGEVQSPPFTHHASRITSPLTHHASRITPPPLTHSLTPFLFGLILPYALTCLILWLAGVFPQFVFWTISYARRYVSQYALVDGPALLRLGLRAAVGPNVLLWLLPWAGALVMWWEHRFTIYDLRFTSSLALATASLPTEDRPPMPGPRKSKIENRKWKVPYPRFFLTALLLCSFASVCVGLHFREHYFITLLPALSLLTGVAVSRAIYVVRYDRTIELFLAAPILIGFVAAVGWALIGNGSVWFVMTPDEAIKDAYFTTLFTDARKVAQEIKASTGPQARIAVLGSEPEICFYSGRRSATGYIYMYPLMERQTFALKMQQEMIAEIERARPEYAVYVKENMSWPAGYQDIISDWWEKYWPANFEMVKTIEIERKRTSDLPAGPQTDTVTLPTDEQKFLFILKRKR